MKKDMPLEGLRWSRDSGSALYDTPPNGRSRTGWGGLEVRNSNSLGLFIRKAKKTLVLSNINRNFATY